MKTHGFETLIEWCRVHCTRMQLMSSALALSIASAGAAYLLTKHHYENLLVQVHPAFVPSTPYKFLRPLVGVHMPGDLNGNLAHIRNGIRSVVSAKSEGIVTRYAVYLRDLGTGHWTGINENDLYDPASMLKVVVAIAAYRQAERDPTFLSHWLAYTPDIAEANAGLPFSLGTKLTVGQSYSVPFLIRAELIDSDNGAAFALLKALPNDTINGVYDDLSITRPSNTDSTGYKLSALEYSRFFRILYNGTLSLNWDDSEQILQSLTESTFTAGLVAGIPSSIPVAHKYGEHVRASTTGLGYDVELSDCGIVYYPSHPYFLCVMTEGSDPDALAKVIAQISKYTYDHIGDTNDLWLPIDTSA